MSFDDPPTRRLPQDPRPRSPIPPRGSGPDEEQQVAVLGERVRTLGTSLAILAVVAVAALGIAFWALLDGGDSTPAPSSGDASGTLLQRVQDLEQRVDARATDGDLKKLRAQVETLKTKVDEAAASSSGDGGGSGTTTSDQTTQLDDLSSKLDDLTTRVDQLESQTSGGTTSTP